MIWFGIDKGERRSVYTVSIPLILLLPALIAVGFVTMATIRGCIQG